MPAEKTHKVIITGTGRAGTTFLVQLLTGLGLDTGYTPETWQRDYHAHCQAGLEHDIEDAAAPYIVKNPGLCESLPGVLTRGRIAIDLAIIPLRRLDDAALSRVRVGGNGRTPGGLTGTNDPAQQRAVLAENFHQLVETLTAHDIPFLFLHFPRFAQDAGYTFEKLRPLLGDIDRARFDACFAQLVRPELIHSFASGATADSGAPARAFAQSRRQRRLARHSARWAAAAALIALGWFTAGWMKEPQPGTAPTTFVQDSLPHRPDPRFGAHGPRFHRDGPWLGLNRPHFPGAHPFPPPWLRAPVATEIPQAPAAEPPASP